MNVESIRVPRIRRDIACQPRVETDNGIIEEYAAAMKAGDKFPAIVVFAEGDDYWLADGFYRTAAAESAGLATIDADVRQGGRRDAILYSVGVNAEHGIRRSNADKERAVSALLSDVEWSDWSDSEIARRCRVSTPFVGRLRSKICPEKMERRKISRAGQTYYMDTASVGKRAVSVTRTRENAHDLPPDDKPVRQTDDESTGAPSLGAATGERSNRGRLARDGEPVVPVAAPVIIEHEEIAPALPGGDAVPDAVTPASTANVPVAARSDDRQEGIGGRHHAEGTVAFYIKTSDRQSAAENGVKMLIFAFADAGIGGRQVVEDWSGDRPDRAEFDAVLNRLLDLEELWWPRDKEVA